MFDCVMPTRNGRNAMLFTYNGTMNMRNKKWEMDFSPVDPDGCDIDRITTKAYLHHLFKAQELLAMQIASIHTWRSIYDSLPMHDSTSNKATSCSGKIRSSTSWGKEYKGHRLDKQTQRPNKVKNIK